MICFLSRKFMFARYILTGRPAIVISPRGINYKELKELNMTIDDLMELVRGCDVFNLADIAYAIVETNGNLCVIKKSNVEPPTREDMKIKVSQNGLPVNIIMDGCLMKENIQMTGIDEKFIMKCMDKAQIKRVKEVLLMTLDNNGEVFIQGRNAKEYYTFQMNYDGGGKW